MKIYCIGNAAVEGDDIPSRLVPFLSQEFPEIEILSTDPTESFSPESQSILIDSISGIDHVCVYSDIDVFVTTKSVSVHDYDLGLHLQLLKKIHKLNPIQIIGIPRDASVTDILPEILEIVRDAFTAEQTVV